MRRMFCTAGRLPVLFGLGLALLIVCPGEAWAFDEQQPAVPWDPQGIEDFSLTERSGKTITKADLVGRPWVACFVFTRCAGPCPRVTSQMRQLQDKLSGTNVQLVTFDVDPEHDTPEVLRQYAETWTADPERWWFLTGEKRALYHLIHHSFKMPVQETLGEDRKPGFEIIHSTNLMHVDAGGRVQGKYNATDDAEVQRLLQALLAPAWVGRLPAVNASLNALATILLIVGYGLIKGGRRRAHQVTMLSAFATSIVFLVCYLVYHYFAGSKHFEGTGLVRPVYFAILISHVILAAAVPVLASITIYRGLKAQWAQHKRLARVTFPIWLYVSVTGVIIYAMLYHWPSGG